MIPATQTQPRTIPVAALQTTVTWTGLIMLTFGVLLVVARFVPAVFTVILPLCLPGLIWGGGDEMQKQYGLWGELFVYWLGAVPFVFGACLIWALIWKTVKDHKKTAGLPL